MIRDFQPNGPQVHFTALIGNVTAGKSNKNNYLTITLQDKSGSIDGKLWNASDEQMTTLTAGLVVDVTADVILYNHEKQLKIIKIAIASRDPQIQLQYLKDAPRDADEMGEELLEYIEKIQNPEISALVKALYDDHFEKILTYPAASRNHHEYVSGLAYHTLSMLKMADAVMTVHPELNRDYLYSGILLHDIGKILELSGPVVPEYTLAGKLVGHISLASAMIYEKAAQLKLGEETTYVLMHLVLSHHGRQEYGSPVLPEILEAEVIYLLDNLDARILMIAKALEGVEPGNFSKRVFSLDNRFFYKPKAASD